jgi:hypothetical protein
VTLPSVQYGDTLSCRWHGVTLTPRSVSISRAEIREDRSTLLCSSLILPKEGVNHFFIEEERVLVFNQTELQHEKKTLALVVYLNHSLNSSCNTLIYTFEVQTKTCLATIALV